MSNSLLTILQEKNKTSFFNGSSVHTCLYKQLPSLDCFFNLTTVDVYSNFI